MDRRKIIAGGLATLAGLAAAKPAMAKPKVAKAAKPKKVETNLPNISGLRQKHGLPAMLFATGSRDPIKNRHPGPVMSIDWVVDGVRRQGKTEPALAADAWHIGSITKSMTALLAARLVEAGKIGWDDRLLDVVRVSVSGAQDYTGATLTHLLMHRSGLPANMPMQQFSAFRLDGSPMFEQRKRCVQEAYKLPPIGPEGGTFQYSNLGYIAAAAMMEATTGDSWENLIREYVFDPLGITPGFGPPKHIWGHRRVITNGKAGPPIPVAPSLFADNPAVMVPAGGVHINAEDMMVYLRAHADRPLFLSPENWDRLHTPHPDGTYAMGWVVSKSGRLTHNGSNTLWYAECGFDPKTGQVAFFATNDGYLPIATKAASEALSSL